MGSRVNSISEIFIKVDFIMKGVVNRQKKKIKFKYNIERTLRPNQFATLLLVGVRLSKNAEGKKGFVIDHTSVYEFFDLAKRS